jgi:hypothetical protein
MPAQVWIDGTDVTSVAKAGASTRRLNRPSEATVTLPMDAAIGGVGSKLKISFNGNLHHHGRVLLCETDTSEDDGNTVYNSTDPLEMWQWRPVRDADGDFSKPSIITDFVTGPQIIEQMIINSEDAGGIPTTAEGDLFIAMGTFATGGVDLSGAPTDWPMTMAELASLLISTGEVDVVLTPIDSGGNMAEIDVYNGNFGTNLSGSLAFQYGMGARNVRNLRWNQDMTGMCNKLQYFAGPRIQSAADPAGDQHWCFNVTGDDPGLADPPQTAIQALRMSSRTTYGVRMEIRVYDAADENCIPGVGTPGRELYRRLWQIESWLRAQPREIVHVTPTRETAIGSFDIGDLVTVEASSAVRGGFSGVQRIYEYTISWSEDSVLALSELQTSPNHEGF